MLLPARRPVLIASAVAALVVTVLGVLFAGQHGPTAFDQSALDAVHDHFGYRHLRVMKAPTNPVLLLVALAVLATTGLATRRRDLALLAVAGPGLSVLLSSFILKPIFDRHYYGGYLAFPSGHTTAVTATCAVGVIAVGLLGKPLLTMLACVLALVVIAAAAIALVGLNYHYLTDTFGGFCVAGATVSGVASVLDRGWPRRFTRVRRRGPAAESVGAGSRPDDHRG